MDLLTPLVVGVLLALFTGLLTWINKGRFDALQTQIEQQQRQIERLAAEVAALRSDLTQVAIAFGTRPRPQTG
jgi:cell division protein FtsB